MTAKTLKYAVVVLVVALITATSSYAQVSGTVTRANNHMSLVDGMAFWDIGVSGVLTNRINWHAKICDSANKCITGYIKSAGTVETYGPELLTNPSFDNTTGWTPSAACTIASVAGGQSGNCLEITATGTGSKYAHTTVGALNAGGLYKYSSYHKDGSLTSKSHQIDFFSNVDFYSPIVTTTGTWAVGAAGYATTNRDGTYYLSLKLSDSASSGTTLFDTPSLKQALTPGITGVVIVSVRGGSTQNWTLIEAGFNYGDLLGYTYTLTPPQTRGMLMGLGMGF